MEQLRKTAFSSTARSIDEGLRAFMLSVYNYMAMALAISGFFAYVVSTSVPLQQMIFGTGLMWVVVLAPVAMAFFVLPKILRMSQGAALATLAIFATIMGISLSSLFMMYSTESIAKTFFITAATFGTVSIYGYTTKRDLTGFGSFLMMGLIGLIIASLVNMFLQSSMLGFITSFIGVIVFTGLIAYDTQRLKEMYYYQGGGEVDSRIAMLGAVSLYMNFINLFVTLLRFFGNRE